MAVFYNDTRKSIRVKEKEKIEWQIKDSPFKGSGKIRNISKSGMLLETNSNLEPKGDFFIFHPNLKTDYIPDSGRLIWRKKKKNRSKSWLCGIEFDCPSEVMSVRLSNRIQKGLIAQENIFKLEKVLNAIVIPVLAGLLGYILFISIEIYRDIRTSNQQMLDTFEEHSFMTRNYSMMYRDMESKYRVVVRELAGVKDELTDAKDELGATKDLYKESQTELTNVNEELKSTQLILLQTEEMLASVKANNALLSKDMDGLKKISEQRLAEIDKIKTELGDTIASLQEKNAQINKEMESIQDKLSYYEGNVKDMEEGAALLTLYHGKMKLVKLKIKQFKQEARQVRISAQKEQDRMRMIIGNNGYFVKDGENR